MSPVKPALERLLKSPQLPSVPGVAIRLLELAQDIESSTRDIVETIKTDPALAARILRSANSSYFSFRSEVKSLEQAVPLIGRTVITSLALSFSLSSEAMDEGPLTRHYKRYWLQSIVQAAAAESLAAHGSKGMATELFMTGLLTDIGQLALLKVLKAQYLPVLDQFSDGRKPLLELEKVQLDCSHVDVGAELLTRWKLPAPMVAAIKYHHSAQDDIPDDLRHDDLVNAVRLASCVGDWFCSGKPGMAYSQLRELAKSVYEFDDAALGRYLDEVEARTRKTAELLNTNSDDLPSPAELMAQAAEQMAEISLRQEQTNREVSRKQEAAESARELLVSQNEKLREQVFRDPLTGLYNRRFFDEALRHETLQAARRGCPIGVLFVDADNFKKLNDTHGHQFGDFVLMRIAQSLDEAIRASDVVARYGGEEFVILAPDTPEAGLRTLAERIRMAIEADSYRKGTVDVTVTVSIGAAVTLPQRDEVDLEARLLEAADAAMYESKRRGRNCTTVHSMASDLERELSKLVLQYRFSTWLVARKIVSSEQLFDLCQSCRPKRSHVGELAFKHQWVSVDDVARALDVQKTTHERFGAIAHRLGLLSYTQLAILLAEQVEDAEALSKKLVSSGLLETNDAALLLDCYHKAIRKSLDEDPGGPMASSLDPVKVTIEPIALGR